LPVIDKGPYGYEYVNVAAQKRDPNSFMDWTERIIRMRKEVPEVGWGDFEILKTGTKEVMGIRYDWRNNSVLFLHNLSPIPREVEFTAGIKDRGQLVNLLSDDHSSPNRSGKYCVLLEPYGYRWYRIGGLDYLLKRDETDKSQQV
jgi:maltose alpha-D-glucosyltransferase / alpha-amylase